MKNCEKCGCMLSVSKYYCMECGTWQTDLEEIQPIKKNDVESATVEHESEPNCDNLEKSTSIIEPTVTQEDVEESNIVDEGNVIINIPKTKDETQIINDDIEECITDLDVAEENSFTNEDSQTTYDLYEDITIEETNIATKENVSTVKSVADEYVQKKEEEAVLEADGGNGLESSDIHSSIQVQEEQPCYVETAEPVSKCMEKVDEEVVEKRKTPKTIKVSTLLIVLAFIAVLVALGVFMYLYFSEQDKETRTNSPSFVSQTTTTATTEQTTQETAVQTVAEEPKDDSYILPNSHKRYVTEGDLIYLNDDELKLARNEIYARHGRKFNDSTIQAYFNSKSWYNGTIESNDFSDVLLNDVERYNVNFIKEYEENGFAVNSYGYDSTPTTTNSTVANVTPTASMGEKTVGSMKFKYITSYTDADTNVKINKVEITENKSSFSKNYMIKINGTVSDNLNRNKYFAYFEYDENGTLLGNYYLTTSQINGTISQTYMLNIQNSNTSQITIDVVII